MISGRAFGAVALCASPHSASKEHDLKHASSVMSLQFKTKRLDRLDAYEQENKEQRTEYNKEKQRKTKNREKPAFCKTLPRNDKHGEENCQKLSVQDEDVKSPVYKVKSPRFKVLSTAR